MDDRQSAPPQPGDTWAVLIGGDVRYAKIIAPKDVLGWWRCREADTSIEFSARHEWLIVRVDSGDD